jgi:hypothetical protein
MRNDERKLIEIAYHRNGVAGNGFYVVLFAWKDPTQATPRRMVATVFEEGGNAAVLDTAETMAGNIAFACGNSWRGDDFEGWLRAQISTLYPPVEAVVESR